MLKWLMLCASILLLSITAAARDTTAAPDESSLPSAPAAAAPVPAGPTDRSAWDLSIGYQYQHYNVFGLRFHNNGFHTDVARYFTNWLALEGTVAMGFGGNVQLGKNHASVKSLFAGGGPHISAPNRTKFEPFVHALFGVQHFRFAQSGTFNGVVIGSNTDFGFMGGGGIDFKIWPRVTWRVEGDYVGTHFQSNLQNNYSFGSSFVFHF